MGIQANSRSSKNLQRHKGARAERTRGNRKTVVLTMKKEVVKNTLQSKKISIKKILLQMTSNKIAKCKLTTSLMSFYSKKVSQLPMTRKSSRVMLHIGRLG